MLKDLGLSEDEILRRAQLPLDLFSRKNAALTAKEYFRIWVDIEVSLNDTVFPLRLGQMISTEAFSPPIFAALCSPNLNVAMEQLSKYHCLCTPFGLEPGCDFSEFTGQKQMDEYQAEGRLYLYKSDKPAALSRLRQAWE